MAEAHLFLNKDFTSFLYPSSELLVPEARNYIIMVNLLFNKQALNVQRRFNGKKFSTIVNLTRFDSKYSENNNKGAKNET